MNGQKYYYNRKSFLVLSNKIILCSILLMVVGCGAESTKEPESDPQEVIEEYYQWITEGNYDRAYEMLANIHRDSYIKDDFALLYFTLKESAQLRSFRVNERERFEDTKLGFVTYEKAVKYDVAQTIFSYHDDREITNTYDGWVVREDCKWRIYREIDENIEEEISNAFQGLAFMYLHGQGKQLDYRRAATTFRTALNYNPNNPLAHFGLGVSLAYLEQYKEALVSFQTALGIFEDLDNTEYRSHSLTWIGYYYEYNGKDNEARKHYKEAINLYPDNQWAIDGLKRVGN